MCQKRSGRPGVTHVKSGKPGPRIPQIRGKAGAEGQSRLPGNGRPERNDSPVARKWDWAGPHEEGPGSTGPAKTRQKPPARCARPPRDGRGPKAVSGRIWTRPVRFDPQNMARSKTGPAPPHQAAPGRCRCSGPPMMSAAPGSRARPLGRGVPGGSSCKKLKSHVGNDIVNKIGRFKAGRQGLRRRVADAARPPGNRDGAGGVRLRRSLAA